MLHVVSTPAGTSGVFVGARHGQGFAVKMTIEIPVSRAVIFWVPVVLLVPMLVRVPVRSTKVNKRTPADVVIKISDLALASTT